MANRRFLSVLMLSLTVLASAACEFINKATSPTAPSSGSSSNSGSGSSANMDRFAGAWQSASAIGVPSPTSCGNLNYTVTPTSTTAATVTFSATCAGNISVNGNGSGTLSGSQLNWNAQGTISQGSLTCPFSFPSDSTKNYAVPEGNAMRVYYNGTICGVGVSGSELVNKK